MTEPVSRQDDQGPSTSASHAVNLPDDPQSPTGEVSTAAPDQYEQFTLPDGIKAASAEHDAAFMEAARELGMSQERAQDAYVLSAALLQRGEASRVQGAAGRAAADHAATVARYVQASRFDRELGGEKLHENLAVASAALHAVGTPALIQILNESGLGNHPDVVRHFLTIAPKFSESKFVSGGRAPAGEKSAAMVLYPQAK